MESNIDSNEGEPNSQINFYTAPAAHLRVKTLIASDSMAGSPNNYKTISKLKPPGSLLIPQFSESRIPHIKSTDLINNQAL